MQQLGWTVFGSGYETVLFTQMVVPNGVTEPHDLWQKRYNIFCIFIQWRIL